MTAIENGTIITPDIQMGWDENGRPPRITIRNRKGDFAPLEITYDQARELFGMLAFLFRPPLAPVFDPRDYPEIR